MLAPPQKVKNRKVFGSFLTAADMNVSTVLLQQNQPKAAVIQRESAAVIVAAFLRGESEKASTA